MTEEKLNKEEGCEGCSNFTEVNNRRLPECTLYKPFNDCPKVIYLQNKIKALEAEVLRLKNKYNEDFDLKYVKALQSRVSAEYERAEKAEAKLDKIRKLKKFKLHADFNMGGECERTYYDEDEVQKFFKDLEEALK